MKLKEKFLKRNHEIRGRAVGFRIDAVRLPNGNQATREYLDHPGAVAVIPLVDKDHVVMVSQYRYPVARITWEIPAGKLDPDESPLACVKRELEEETGYTAGRITKLLSFWPTASFANEIIHIYVAQNLKPGKANPDSDEFLNAKTWPLSKLYRDIRAGKIKDAKTLIGLLAYHAQSCPKK